MATLEDVRRIALALPGVVEGTAYGGPAWKAGRGLLVWERPLRKAELAGLGEAAPSGVVLGVHVEDEGVKHALIADEPDVFFTTPHFDGYAAVLVRLDAIGQSELEELVLGVAAAGAEAGGEVLPGRARVGDLGIGATRLRAVRRAAWRTCVNRADPEKPCTTATFGRRFCRRLGLGSWSWVRDRTCWEVRSTCPR